MSKEPALPGVKAVFFDLFNTLARFWPPREEVQAQACQAFGIALDTSRVDLGYAEADAYMTRENSSAPLRTRTNAQTDAFFARYEQIILKGAGVDVDLAVAGQVWQRVRQIPYGLTLFDDVLPSLRRLRQKGLVLGMISNLNRPGDALTKELGLTGTLHFAVTSFEAQAEKPDAAIFQAAIERAGVPASEAVHVGDQVSSDVEGARGAGIRPVLMDRYGTGPRAAGCPVVHSMVELERLLDP
ncbi:MAG: HAD family hydrolase [Dehalococcoidia bacterium]|nr:HAD family hydrolase [Dehalococcoidia bacterium]